MDDFGKWEKSSKIIEMIFDTPYWPNALRLEILNLNSYKTNHYLKKFSFSFFFFEMSSKS